MTSGDFFDKTPHDITPAATGEVVTPAPAPAPLRPMTGPLPTDPEKLRAGIEFRQERMAATLAELRERTAPKTLAGQAKDDSSSKVKNALYDEFGNLRPEAIGAIGAVGFLLLAMLLNRSLRKGKKKDI